MTLYGGDRPGNVRAIVACTARSARHPRSTLPRSAIRILLRGPWLLGRHGRLLGRCRRLGRRLPRDSWCCEPDDAAENGSSENSSDVFQRRRPRSGCRASLIGRSTLRPPKTDRSVDGCRFLKFQLASPRRKRYRYRPPTQPTPQLREFSFSTRDRQRCLRRSSLGSGRSICRIRARRMGTTASGSVRD
jgi:hypothetical protein